MSRLLLVALLAVVVSRPVNSAEPPKSKAPDLGIDYQALFGEHMKLIAEGKGDRAFDFLVGLGREGEGFSLEAKDVIKKRYAVLYGAGGKCHGNELVAYKRITSRVIRFYAVSHYDKLAVTHIYTFTKGEDQWKLSSYTLFDGVEELDKFTPAVPLGPARD